MNISDIAALAGVSKAAVSRYLNNGYLSEEKRAAIRAVIEQTGYQPLAQARALRTKKNRTVGVILPKLESFSVSTVVAGILSVLNREGYQVLLSHTENSPEKELEYLQLFSNQQVEGVILLASVLSPRHLALLRRMPVPLVVVGQQAPGFACVYHDDYNAFVEITNLVLARGCRNLGFLRAMPQDKAVGEERYRAYCDAVTAAGLPALAAQAAVAAFTIPSGCETAGLLLDRYPGLDALICSTDRMAVGALQCLHRRGIRVPEQLLLTGQGGAEMCGVTTPTITTIRFSYKESGATAAALLLERIRDPGTPVKEVKLGYTILEQGSTQRGG